MIFLRNKIGLFFYTDGIGIGIGIGYSYIKVRKSQTQKAVKNASTNNNVLPRVAMLRIARYGYRVYSNEVYRVRGKPFPVVDDESSYQSPHVVQSVMKSLV